MIISHQKYQRPDFVVQTLREATHVLNTIKTCVDKQYYLFHAWWMLSPWMVQVNSIHGPFTSGAFFARYRMNGTMVRA